MIGAFQQLMLSASIYIVCAFVLGLVFDRFGGGPLRQAVSGTLIAVVVTALQIAPLEVGAFAIDVDTPLLLVSTLYGGPITAAVVLPAPMLVAIFSESPTLMADLLAIVAPVLVGLTVLAIWMALEWPIDKRAVCISAVLAPLTLLPSILLPAGEIDLESLSSIAFWTALGTLVFGLTLANETRRAKASRRRRKERLFHSLTGTVPRTAFRQHLEEQWSQYQRLGQEYTCLMIAIDGAAALRRSMSAQEWDRIRAVAAAAITEATRDSDVCTPIEEDRFALILPHANLFHSLPVARRVQDAIDAAIRRTRPDFALTVSIGCAEVSGTLAPGEVEADAEGQLYAATANDVPGTVFPPAQTVIDTTVRPAPAATVGEIAGPTAGTPRRADLHAVATA
ncbi:diguanylate cyclase [Acuticoccus sp. I52.16.1]|uniref:diguanylate cyclase n=1 Tax=Acuticoccus sp. I52.16.1 TaxID=2928472 RepID=UPI001FD1A9BC|nr:GGDEF domain-containing protein [Acuticoccus sp. I52.16.1]UOM33969.1 GGDEF domain-containing protein [Acuticoccus sp. I52.16.1]